jgi:hypothetical protein
MRVPHHVWIIGEAWTNIYSIVNKQHDTSLIHTILYIQCIGLHCNENPIYVVLFWELRGLSPNFHIHVSVSDLYTPRIAPHISCSRIS